ncbi:fasciclin domain-containing protein [Allopontixanthobacter sp.]|uniref:fasciclin domain-containing protein n=1 Tax=Allopontixanthobacter sp. TaxID=2906452 RepID=UPI002AB975F3|nr:fasciclin domain-containing protein [Allopontixanthobacter sp.]MDZ4308283.1 fasciclin domain-containing protein [Allopontixanthobacter sp.]
MMRTRLFAAVAAIALLSGTSACNEADVPETSSVETGQSISGSLGDIEGMETANDLIKRAGLEQMLEGEAAYTLFLPNDQAFAKLPEAELDWLRSEEGRPDLIALLRHHMVPGTVAQSDLETTLSESGGTVDLANLANSTLPLRRDGSTIVIGDDAAGPVVSLPAHSASNGMVYEISALIPPES